MLYKCIAIGALGSVAAFSPMLGEDGHGQFHGSPPEQVDRLGGEGHGMYRPPVELGREGHGTFQGGEQKKMFGADGHGIYRPPVELGRDGHGVFRPESKTTLRAEVIPKFLVDVNAGSHYGDPNTGCESDEKAVSITGVSGSVCTPSCSTGACPTDVPAGVTATPTCALQDPQGNKYCVLICSPSELGDNSIDTQCGENASCKSIQGMGVCTYDQ
jgi:hypothetical protein